MMNGKEERKYSYWTMPLQTNSGVAWIDRRDVSGFVKNKETGELDIHLKSGTIFTVKECSVDTIANLYLTQSPHEEVHIVPNNKQESEE